METQTQQGFTRDQIREMLNEPFDESQIRYRQGAYGRSLAYLDGPTVYDRLNRATNSWSFEISKSYFDYTEDKQGNRTRVMVVEGHLTIPELGTRAGTGVQVLSPGSGEDMFKGARTDAIKNAASLFGVGLHLYSDITTDQSERGYGMNQQQSQRPDERYMGAEEHDPYYQAQRSQPVPQGQGQSGGYQRATGDRVRGGATVKQVNAIKAIANDKGIPEDDVLRMVANETGGEMDYEALNSKGASNIIGHLNSL